MPHAESLSLLTAAFSCKNSLGQKGHLQEMIPKWLASLHFKTNCFLNFLHDSFVHWQRACGFSFLTLPLLWLFLRCSFCCAWLLLPLTTGRQCWDVNWCLTRPLCITAHLLSSLGRREEALEFIVKCGIDITVTDIAKETSYYKTFLDKT